MRAPPTIVTQENPGRAVTQRAGARSRHPIQEKASYNERYRSPGVLTQ
jgi:hypothetical protein